MVPSILKWKIMMYDDNNNSTHRCDDKNDNVKDDDRSLRNS